MRNRSGTASREAVGERGDAGRRGGRDQRAHGDEPVRRHAVGEVEHGRRHGAGDEAELDRRRQPHGAARGQLPLGAQGGDDGGRREPRRHDQHLHGGDGGELPESGSLHRPPAVRPRGRLRRMSTLPHAAG